MIPEQFKERRSELDHLMIAWDNCSEEQRRAFLGATFDADLQSRIDEATLRLMFSPEREERMRAMDELRELKAQQRPERVAELEKMRGLR